MLQYQSFSLLKLFLILGIPPCGPPLFPILLIPSVRREVPSLLPEFFLLIILVGEPLVYLFIFCWEVLFISFNLLECIFELFLLLLAHELIIFSIFIFIKHLFFVYKWLIALFFFVLKLSFPSKLCLVFVKFPFPFLLHLFPFLTFSDHLLLPTSFIQFRILTETYVILSIVIFIQSVHLPFNHSELS